MNYLNFDYGTTFKREFFKVWLQFQIVVDRRYIFGKSFEMTWAHFSWKFIGWMISKQKIKINCLN